MNKLIILALLCSPSWGAPAFVQASQTSSAGPATVWNAPATATTAGNSIVVFIYVNDACLTRVTTITDTAGNTYYALGQAVNPSGSCIRAYMAFNIVANATNVVTATYGASTVFSYVTQLEFSGVDRATPRDAQTGSFHGGGTSINSTLFSTFYADEVMVFGMDIIQASQTWTPASGYTIPTGATSSDGVQAAGYRVYSAAQTGISATFTNTGNAQMQMLGIGLIGTLRASLPANSGSIR